MSAALQPVFLQASLGLLSEEGHTLYGGGGEGMGGKGWGVGGGGGVDWVWPAALSGKWGKQGQEVGLLDFTDKARDLQARWSGGGCGGGLPSALPCPRARE